MKWVNSYPLNFDYLLHNFEICFDNLVLDKCNNNNNTFNILL